jgi:hypothetical protein
LTGIGIFYYRRQKRLNLDKLPPEVSQHYQNFYTTGYGMGKKIPIFKNDPNWKIPISKNYSIFVVHFL